MKETRRAVYDNSSLEFLCMKCDDWYPAEFYSMGDTSGFYDLPTFIKRGHMWACDHCIMDLVHESGLYKFKHPVETGDTKDDVESMCGQS